MDLVFGAELKKLILKFVLPLLGLAVLFSTPFILHLIPQDFLDFSDENEFDEKVIPISWKDLRDLDFRTGEYSDALRALERKLVKLPGFIVPLVDDVGEVSEFLLVPSPQACIHVPPPPPNQMVHVILQETIPYHSQYRAIYATGRLLIANTRSKYGKASFMMEGLKVERFRR